MKLGVEAFVIWERGELSVFRSSLLPSIDEIDMPPDGRDENEARSRAPEKREAIGGPRGALPGEGGGMWRDWKEGGIGGGSRGSIQRRSALFSTGRQDATRTHAVVESAMDCQGRWSAVARGRMAATCLRRSEEEDGQLGAKTKAAAVEGEEEAVRHG